MSRCPFENWYIFGECLRDYKCCHSGIENSRDTRSSAAHEAGKNTKAHVMIVLCGFAGTQKNRSADTEYRGPGKLFCSSGDLITGGAEKLQGQRAKIRQKARENPGGKRKKILGG